MYLKTLLVAMAFPRTFHTLPLPMPNGQWEKAHFSNIQPDTAPFSFILGYSYPQSNFGKSSSTGVRLRRPTGNNTTGGSLFHQKLEGIFKVPTKFVIRDLAGKMNGVGLLYRRWGLGYRVNKASNRPVFEIYDTDMNFKINYHVAWWKIEPIKYLKTRNMWNKWNRRNMRPNPIHQ